MCIGGVCSADDYVFEGILRGFETCFFRVCLGVFLGADNLEDLYITMKLAATFTGLNAAMGKVMRERRR